MNTRIVSGFPGVGKSTLFKSQGDRKILDSDSSSFSWADPVAKIRHPEWPRNYLMHILENRGRVDIILISSHEPVRQMLVKVGIKFDLVYPGLNIKEEYIQRYRTRGNNPEFVKLLEKNYDQWIVELMAQDGCNHIVLGPGQYLSDVL